MELENIGKLIREWRQRRGLTQWRLATLLDVDVKTVQRWEAGRHKPCKWVLPSLLRLLREEEQQEE